MLYRLTLALLFVLPLSAVAGPDASRAKLWVIDSIDAIGGAEGDGALDIGAHWGSGTVIASKDHASYILTCKHVCPDRGAVIRVFIGRESYAADWVAADDRADLSLIRIRGDLPAVALAADAPKVGDAVEQWGYPKAGPTEHKAGHVADPTKTHDKDDAFDPYRPTAFITDYAAIPGDSGAGVFDASGKLVGVCYRKFLSDAGKSGCIPLADVRRFLAANGVK